MPSERRREASPSRRSSPSASGLGTLVVPNAVVLIAGAPHADEGRRFIDFLLSPEVEQALAESDAAQMPVRPGVRGPKGVVPLQDLKSMDVDYERLGAVLDVIQRGMAEGVGRSQPEVTFGMLSPLRLERTGLPGAALLALLVGLLVAPLLPLARERLWGLGGSTSASRPHWCADS